jgi:hypothetical protein
MDALIHHLSNVGPWTAGGGVAMCCAAAYLRAPQLERTGMYVCIIAAGELATLLIVRIFAT